MVVCNASMPMETRQQTTQMKDPPRLHDGPRIAIPGGRDQGGVEEDDREEGEIVDDFEMIISSEDEEFKLRARIQQLEENNKDVERMDMLSANLENQYNYSKPVERTFRYKQKQPIYVLSDVSSQSENELQEQRKYRRHKVRRMEPAEKRHHRTTNGGGDYRRNPLSKRTKHKQLSPSPPPLHRRRHSYHQQRSYHQLQDQQHHYGNSSPHHQDRILLASLDSSGTDDECDANNDIEDDKLDLERLKLSRDKLRVALALEERQEELCQYKNSLRERLQYRLGKSPSTKYKREFPRENEIQPLPPLQALSDADEDEPQSNHQENQDSVHSTEDPAEMRLRLIALKSAILKKHFARKKRDAERAYSPTDMINRVHPAISNGDDIDDLMEISPAASPERIPSPPRYSIDDAVDTKPVDMELAETDSDDQHNAWDSWTNNWNSMDHAGGSWRCFMPNSLPPVSMPIVIDEDDAEEDIKTGFGEGRTIELSTDDEVPPPPPPFHIPHMHLDDEDARDAMHLVDQHSNHSSFTDMQSVTMDNSQTQSKSLDNYKPQSSDDEAGALRAMLLSNLRTNKPPPPPPERKPLLPTPVNDPIPVPPPTAKLHEESDSSTRDSDDPEELRSLLLSSIANKNHTSHPPKKSATSPLILKNAVMRFQPIKTEESLEDQQPIAEDIIEPKADEKDLTEPRPGDEGLSQDQQSVDEGLAEPNVVEIIAETSIREPASPISMEAVQKTPQPPAVQPSIHPSTQATKNTSSPSTKIIKIVKPNKVINKMTTTKRKLPMDEQSVSSLSTKRPTTLMIKETSAPLHGKNGISSSASTRLITTVDPASIKVNKMVISLAEESAASDDDLELGSFFANANYMDIASPLSMAMAGTPSGSTTRSNTPISEIVETAPGENGNIRRTLINEYFEKKIDDFLRQARSSAPPSGNSSEAATVSAAPVKVPQKPKVNGKVQPAVTTPIIRQQLKTTPVAVRHLPAEAQKEYIRLIERMQLLEQKKMQAKKTALPPSVTASKAPAKNGFHKPAKEAVVAPTSTSCEATIIPGKPLVKSPQAQASNQKTELSQAPQESRLRAFENSFARIGSSMITNIDKSLQIVEEAQKSKVIRMRCSQRLNELYSEIQSVKFAARQEELKLSRMQPEIKASHDTIISMRQKRLKLRAAAMDLGRGLRGDDYRLRDDSKEDISLKSRQLSKKIRLYNSIVKFDDLNKLTEVEQREEEAPKSVIENGGEREEQPNVLKEMSSPSERTAPAAVETEKKTQPDPEPTAAETPDNLAQDEATEIPKMDLPGPYTITTMRQLCEVKLEAEAMPSKKHYLTTYQSPMSRNYNSHLDVHATICPFDLMGRCEDVDCSYLHLARPEPAPSELRTTTNLSPIH